MHSARTSRPLGFLACAAAGSLWGTGFFFGKIALQEMSVGHMVLYRFLFAMPVALPLALRRAAPWTRREWTVLAVSAFFGIPLQFLVQFQGLSLTTVAHASLMVGTMPVLLAVTAATFLHERLDALGWVALATSTLGACLIALAGKSSGGASLAGDLLVVASLLIALVWIMGNKELMRRHDSLAVTSRSLVLGMAMLALWVCLRDGLPPVRNVSPHAWAALAASGLLCTAATTALWNWGLTQIPASQAGVFLNLEPVIGSALGVWMLQERLGSAAWAGGVLIVGSALLLTVRDPSAGYAADLIAAE